MVAIEFSRRRKHESSASGTFVRLIVLNYKSVRQIRRQSVRIQSALCEVACEENSRGSKIAVVKIDRTVVSVYSISLSRIANSRIANKQVIVVYVGNCDT